MPRVELDTQYMHLGDRFGPGLTDVPDELAIALGIMSADRSPSNDPPTNETSANGSNAEEVQTDEQTEDETQKPEGRLMINTATAEAIADRLSGVGLNTANKVVALRESLPDQKLSIGTLRSISRADWDALASEIDFA